MEISYTEVSDPTWANSEHTLIDCIVNFSHIPEEAVKFTASLNDNTSHGPKIFNECVSGKYGVIKDYTPPPPLSNEILSINAKFFRDLKLSESDWTQLPDVPTTVKEKWAAYRQALRDIPQQPDFPQNIIWPDQP